MDRTPSEEKKILELEEQKVIIQKQKDEWTACCSKSDSHFVKFVTQILFSGSVMIFSLIQVARGGGQNEIYFSLISGILGYWMPNPSLPEKR